MLLRLANSLRFLTQALTAHASPRAVAMGFAIGVAVGLVPKGNLTVVFLALLLFTLRVNLAAGLVSAVMFSWLGLLADPLLDHVGMVILSIPAVQGIFAGLHEQPIVPWAQWNNTVVVGALAVGLLQIYPTCWCMTPYFEKRLVGWSTSVGQFPLGRALFSRDAVGTGSIG